MTRNIAIVGGGASGTVVAAHLLRQTRRRLRINIIEPRDQLALGVAYSTSFDSHLLNVRAGAMSALPDEPAHFLNWLRVNCVPRATSGLFASRPISGAYLRSLLEDATQRANGRVEVVHVRAEAARLSTNGHSFVVVTDRGQAINADAVLLALGNLTSGNPLPLGSEEPTGAWSPGATDGIPREATVVLLGAGLTAIDICMSLQQVGHRGVIHLVSRHGLLPRVMLPVHRSRQSGMIFPGTQCDRCWRR